MECSVCHRIDPSCGFIRPGRRCRDCVNQRALARYHERMRDPEFREAQRVKQRPEGVRPTPTRYRQEDRPGTGTCGTCHRVDPPCGMCPERRTLCLDCRRKQASESYRRTMQEPERARRLKAYRAKHYQNARANGRAGGRYPSQMRGLTYDEYESMLADLDGRCAICRRTPERFKRKVLHIDHDHVTNKARGLLCHNCNIMLGVAEDNIATLAAAVEYLSRYQAGGH